MSLTPEPQVDTQPARPATQEPPAQTRSGLLGESRPSANQRRRWTGTCCAVTSEQGGGALRFRLVSPGLESAGLCRLQPCSLSEAAVAGSRPPSPNSAPRRPGSAATAPRPGPRTTTWWWSAEGTRAQRQPPRPRGAAPGLCSSRTAWTRSVRAGPLWRFA